MHLQPMALRAGGVKAQRGAERDAERSDAALTAPDLRGWPSGKSGSSHRQVVVLAQRCLTELAEQLVETIQRHRHWRSLSLTAVRSATGMVVAALISQVIAGFLFGIPPVDPVTFTGTVVLFVAIGLVGCYMPLRRAIRIDPAKALRYE